MTKTFKVFLFRSPFQKLINRRNRKNLYHYTSVIPSITPFIMNLKLIDCGFQFTILFSVLVAKADLCTLLKHFIIELAVYSKKNLLRM